MSDKEIDLGEGCKVRISKKDDGSKEFCVDCEGKEEFKFSYKRKGSDASQIFDNVSKIAEKRFSQIMGLEKEDE